MGKYVIYSLKGHRDMEKIYGAEKAQNSLTKIGRGKYEVIYGYGVDENGGYNWRKRYDHEPAIAEIKADVESLINAETDGKILSGFVWNGQSVWLSLENQINFKAAYDLAVQTDGETLPKKLKLGEDDEGRPMYHLFESVSEFTEFYKSAVEYIEKTIQEGWEEKDGVNYGEYIDD